MDRFERQYKFTTFQTKKAHSLNPIFNQTFYMPLYQGDIEAFAAINRSGRPYNEKERRRCGIQVHVQNYDEQIGDHDSYGSCMLWFSEMGISPQNLDECPKIIRIPLGGPGTVEEIAGGVDTVKSGWGNDDILPQTQKIDLTYSLRLAFVRRLPRCMKLKRKIRKQYNNVYV